MDLFQCRLPDQIYPLAILNPHNANSKTMTVEQILQKEIEESTTWLD
ncbi:MAG TPA: hypothetical protein VF220_07290 [Nitrososphaeraceae archaeon]